jgi:hypothetical protein
MARVEIPRPRFEFFACRFFVSEIYLQVSDISSCQSCPKKLYKYRTGGHVSDIKSAISSQINAAGPGHVWVPTDFALLGNRDAIDKTLQRMVLAGDLRRVDRGLYDKPIINCLSSKST